MFCWQWLHLQCFMVYIYSRTFSQEMSSLLLLIQQENGWHVELLRMQGTISVYASQCMPARIQGFLHFDGGGGRGCQLTLEELYRRFLTIPYNSTCRWLTYEAVQNWDGCTSHPDLKTFSGLLSIFLSSQFLIRMLSSSWLNSYNSSH